MCDHLCFPGLSETGEGSRAGVKNRLYPAAAYGSYYKNEFVDFISIRSSLVTKKQIQAAHEYGKAIHVWTVNSRSEIEQMALMGVDNIITDYPTRAKEVLYQPDVAKNLLTYIRQVMK